YQEMFEQLPEHEFLGEIVKGKLHYYPTVTREPFRNQGRITDLINNNVFPQCLGLPALNPETDRVMLCGSPAMLADLKHMMEVRGFKEGHTTTPGDFVI
ncbi:ferredoxin--NADP reductase, partial [Enterococcus faecium]